MKPKIITVGKKYRGNRVKPYIRLEGSILNRMPIRSRIACEPTPEGLLLRLITTT